MNDRIRPFLTGLFLSTAIGLLNLPTITVSFSEEPLPSAPALVSLDRAVHFLAPDGSDIVASPGLYMVRQEGDSQLALIPGEGKEHLVVQAVLTNHKKEFPVQGVSLSGGEDEHYVILLLPEGKALEAMGSYTGMRSRALTMTEAKAAPCLHIPALSCIPEGPPSILGVTPKEITYHTRVTVSGRNLAAVKPEWECMTPTFCAPFVKLSDSAGFYGEKAFLHISDWKISKDGTAITFEVSGPLPWWPSANLYRSLYYQEGAQGRRFAGLTPEPGRWTGRLRFRNPSIQSTPNNNYYSLTSPQIITWTKSSQ
jgi:hypothetical protein